MKRVSQGVYEVRFAGNAVQGGVVAAGGTMGTVQFANGTFTVTMYRPGEPRCTRDRSSGGASAMRVSSTDGVDADFSGKSLDADPDVGRHRIEGEIERNGEVLCNRHGLEQHDPIARDADAFDEGEPLFTVRDLLRRTTEGDDLACLRQGRTGYEVNEDLGGRAVEADQHGDPPAGYAQITHPQRPQSAVLLFDVCENDRVGRIGFQNNLLQQLIDFGDHTAAFGKSVDFHAKRAQVEREAGIREYGVHA